MKSKLLEAMPGSESRSTQRLVITIDGPAGTGKSTVAHLLARRLGVEFLDTGAMYRAAALIAIERDIDPEDGERLALTIQGVDLHFDWKSDPPRLLIGNRDVSAAIREMEVSSIVSRVAAQSSVRRVLVDQQRRIAQKHPRLVSEGRDQGSVVFPDAAVRFFLNADVTVRARRRAEQLAAAGREVDRKQIARDIRERDRIDSSREDGPLIKPENAIEVDTTSLTIEQVVDELERQVRSRVPHVAQSK